jgi:hypothetical protein
MRTVVRVVGVESDADADRQANAPVTRDAEGVAQSTQDLLGGNLLSAPSRSRLDYSRLRQQASRRAMPNAGG